MIPGKDEMHIQLTDINSVMSRRYNFVVLIAWQWLLVDANWCVLVFKATAAWPPGKTARYLQRHLALEVAFCICWSQHFYYDIALMFLDVAHTELMIPNKSDMHIQLSEFTGVMSGCNFVRIKWIYAMFSTEEPWSPYSRVQDLFLRDNWIYLHKFNFTYSLIFWFGPKLHKCLRYLRGWQNRREHSELTFTWPVYKMIIYEFWLNIYLTSRVPFAISKKSTISLSCLIIQNSRCK